MSNWASLRERLLAILGKHCRHNIDNDIEFSLVGGSHIDEHVSSVQGDLAML
jgi:hypothetical protein